jgi:PilZ domain-containing protein
MLTGDSNRIFETLKLCNLAFWSSSMADTQRDQENDKRATRRFALRLPVTVRYGEDSEEHAAQTRDVSARGICFYVDSAIQAGSAIDFTLTLPPEITLTESIRVRCKGRVMRVEGGSPAGKLAVAAVIDEYEFLADS